MFVAYNGPKAQVYIFEGLKRRYLYRKNVPTYVSESLSRNLTEDFTFIEDEIKISKWAKDKIFVKMPFKTLEFYIASFRTLYRIREYFPTCDIEVHTTKDLKSLLPGFVIPSLVYSPNALRNYYRLFDISDKSGVLKEKFRTPSLFRQVNYEQLILQASTLWNPVVDKPKVENSYLTIPKNISNYVVVQTNKYNPHAWVEAFIPYLKSKSIEVKILQGNVFKPEYIPLLNNSICNLITEDGGLGYLSASLNTPTLCYRNRKAMPADWIFERWPNVKLILRDSIKDIDQDKINKTLYQFVHKTSERIEITING